MPLRNRLVLDESSGKDTFQMKWTNEPESYLNSETDEDDPLEIFYLYFGILKNVLVTVSPEFSEERNT